MSNPKPKLIVEEAHPDGRTIDAETLRALLRHALEDEDVTLHSLTVVLAGRDLVLRLNREHLGHDDPTDVLAFPFCEEDGVVDGEVYVDLDTAAERCAEFDATPEQEARRYALHGVLHLVGYRDKTDAGRRKMRALENRYLAASSGATSEAGGG